MPCRWTLGRSSTVGPDGNPHCVEGLELPSVEFVYGSPYDYRRNSSPLPPANVPTSPISTLKSCCPYQYPGMLRHPRLFSKTSPPPRMSFYVKEPSGEPSKPRMSVHIRSSTGAIKPIPSRFVVLRQQSPLIAWTRRMSYMLTPNTLHNPPFLPLLRFAPDGQYAFRITWSSAVSEEGRVAWTPLTSPPN
jgi:hypothetical protein